MASEGESARRVLVVEDDECTRESLGLVLQAEGYQVASATNGLEALSHLRCRPPPHCILLDLRMPVMDGLQFRRRQVEDPILAAIPVIVVTAERNLRAQVEGLHVHDYFQKPIEMDDLLAALRRVCWRPPRALP